MLKDMKFGRERFPCISFTGKGARPDVPDPLLLTLYDTYCFDPNLPALRLHSMPRSGTTRFNDLVSFQDRFLAKQIEFADGPHKHLTATVDSITMTSDNDPAFTPAQDAVISQPAPLTPTAGFIGGGQLVKRVQPDYPGDAKDRGISGFVVLQVMIGKDGAVHDIHVISSPLPSLAAAAQHAVSQWRYTPYNINGVPVECRTNINVFFGR